MIESPSGLRLIVLAAIVLCMVASLTGAKGADEKGSGLRVAIVDLDKVQADYNPLKTFRDLTDKQRNDLQTEYEVLQRHRLLPEADQKVLVDLTIKEKAAGVQGLAKADADKKKALETQSDALLADYSKLVQTQIGLIKPEDEVRLKDYTKRANDAETRVKTHQQSLANEAGGKAKDVEQAYFDSLQKALSDVAKKSGYNLILNKQVAPYAEFECTKDVLTLMNKK